MMNSMIKENTLTFKEIEQKIFGFCCALARSLAKMFLEAYDKRLMKERDKKAYRHKGYRKTSVKTVFGEVTYKRAVYEYTDDSGTTHFVYLLDEMLGLKSIGLISENYAEQLVNGITTKSYRDCAKEVTATTGQCISPMGVWNVIQALGESVSEEEKQLVKQNKKKKLKGMRKATVLFEEADGVNLKLQGKDRAATKTGLAEMKVAIAYDGWEKVGEGRYHLDGKVVFAGFAKSKDFHKIREAKIAAEYDLDETELRILNGDGASWIKKVQDKSTVFQLDPFHRNKAIRENILNTKARKDITELLREGKTDEMFRYLELYHNSLSDEEEIEKVETLIQYFRDNEEGLLPYQEREAMPESPEGVEYRNLGTMENHIWSIVAKRMKHNHTTWSKAGANNLAKLLAKKCEGKLYEVTAKLKVPRFEEELSEELLGEILTPAQVKEQIGSGYEYPVKGSLTWLYRNLIGDVKVLFEYAGAWSTV